MLASDYTPGWSVPTSEELMGRARDGDVRAFADLYDRHARHAFGLAIAVTGDRASAEDVVQESFLSVWRAAQRFDAVRAPFAAWLAVIVRRRSIDQLRRRRPATDPLDDGTALPPSMVAGDAWSEVGPRLDRAALLAAMAALTPPQREALQLAFFGEFTQVEVAERLGIPLGTAKSRIRNGLRALRLRITD